MKERKRKKQKGKKLLLMLALTFLLVIVQNTAALAVTADDSVNISEAGIDTGNKDSSAVSEDDFVCMYYDEDAKEVELGAYEGTATDVTVPSVIKGYRVSGIGKYTFSDNTEVKRIVLPESIHSIENGAFNGCSNLEVLEMYGATSFYGNSNPADTPSNMLSGCSKLKKLIIGDGCNFKITNSWGSLNIFDSDVANHLEYIYLGNNMNNVSQFLFYGSSLKWIDIGENNQVYHSIDGVVYNAAEDTILVVPTQYEAQTFVIPDHVTKILGVGFDSCQNIRQIYIPQSVETIGGNSFNGISPTLYVVQGTAGEKFAEEHGMTYRNYGIYFLQKTLNLTVGESVSNPVTNETSNELNWTNSNQNVAVGSENGIIQALSPGTAVITVTDGNFTVSCTVNVTEKSSNPPSQEGMTDTDNQEPENTDNQEPENTDNQEPENTDIQKPTQVNTPETATKTSLKKADIILAVNSYTYNGKAKKPAVKSVKIDGKTLKSGRDYKVSYKNNKNIGTATVVVTGKGKYTGTAVKSFKITAKKGSKYTVGFNCYKITGNNTVSFAGWKSKKTVTKTIDAGNSIVSYTTVKSAKTTKVTIPKTVKIGGKNFKVTAVEAKALQNNKKVTGITIGANVTKIGKNAFTNCRKLGTIQIKSAKLKTVGKNVFKGIKATAKIKVPAKKLSAYKKLLKGKGQGTGVKIAKYTTK